MKIKEKNVLIFAGLGGNGGDGFVAARHFLSKGAKVKVITLGNPSHIKHKSTLENYNKLRRMKDIKIVIIEDPSQLIESKADVVIDAVLGTGVQGSLREPVKTAIKIMNKTLGFKVAVDTPTGLNPDTGELSPTGVFKADLTVTFHRSKKGFIAKGVKKYIGKLVVEDIGITKKIEQIAGPGDLWLALGKRDATSHKGDNGRILILGASDLYVGAPALTGLAALRTGADIVRIAAPEESAKIIASYSPNLITYRLKGDYLSPKSSSAILQLLPQHDTIIIGPGLGDHAETMKAVKDVIRHANSQALKCVIDADALNVASQFPKKLPPQTVLTPHAGEFNAMFGEEPPSDLKRRGKTVSDAALKLGCTILLKGPVDVVSDGKHIKYNHTGNAGMTVGGTGDVLAGIVGALLSQGSPTFTAAAAAAYLNGAAGDLAYQSKGNQLIATDLIENLPQVINKME
jgi:NAD(P)H-hydrate epimerase